jgi:hypothetical protein
MWNIQRTDLAKPKIRKYAEYLLQCERVKRGEEDANVNGVHGKWLLNALSYAEFIHPTKDSMHCATNIICDSLNVLKPNTTTPSKFENRTMRPNNIISCRQYSIFPFTYSDAPEFPWILTREELAEHDRRFLHVLGIH